MMREILLILVVNDNTERLEIVFFEYQMLIFYLFSLLLLFLFLDTKFNLHCFNYVKEHGINEFKRSSNMCESTFNLVNSIIGGGIIGKLYAHIWNTSLYYKYILLSKFIFHDSYYFLLYVIKQFILILARYLFELNGPNKLSVVIFVVLDMNM